ncbi:GatB/YqeY domain-containing protein [Halobacillus kuroshimensis]|uniref:GatB/YqeY domain-containing protein n=2 Tax=Halobacillus TaxID=45667 RepID=A0A845DQP3_9BACI|nr:MULTISPECIES: GatB/YqeY domain-containing protein [Halobacillus]MBN8236678.1 GatB/YqeY domain-containing protein [Halobacillus kuroshimensis]MCA1021429.1 GatB/YqeY domain-containing protein [Halobacillus litoralis]MYL19820.1 GatB/YqeY domain-containing protein [Halobacillus litoralis]MYL28966.1 GatB/YqeY domain-containing protein [Halobacillus halophilus]MYL37217.1 GatB/YqeY domain-containing protein [Halobacillus litoralis]
MTITDRLTQDMKTAMKARDKEKLSTIRMVRASMQNEAIKLGKDSLSEEEALTVLSREVKQRNDSLHEFKEAGRDDLVEGLEREIEILQVYMPKQLTDEELEQIVNETIEEVGAASKSDMGKVMSAIMPKVKGRADGSQVNKFVLQQLS